LKDNFIFVRTCVFNFLYLKIHTHITTPTHLQHNIGTKYITRGEILTEDIFKYVNNSEMLQNIQRRRLTYIPDFQ
jgi:hypothetical protein